MTAPPQFSTSSLSILDFLSSTSSSTLVFPSFPSATHRPVAFPSSSLCPESAEEKQMLVSAGLWSHYHQSIASLTHSFRHFTQRTLAAYKQLSHSHTVDSADLRAALYLLNSRYVSTHRVTLAMYTAHANATRAQADDLSGALASDHSATSSTQAKSKPPIKAVRSLTTKRPAQPRKQRIKSTGRTSFSPASTSPLRVWFRNHLRSPYPREREKTRLSKASGMNMEQVANWFVNARMRLWRKYIVEERDKVKVEKEQHEKEEKDEADEDSKPTRQRATREERMKRRAVKMQAAEQSKAVKVEDELSTQPRKRRRQEASDSAHVQSAVAQPTAVASSAAPSYLPSPSPEYHSAVSFAPLLSITMQSFPAFGATVSFSNSASPSHLPRLQSTSAAVSSSSWSSLPLLSPSAAFSLSSLPLFNLPSQPPPVAFTSGRYRATALDFEMPATLTMSMTLPSTLQLPAVMDTAEAESTQTCQQRTRADTAGDEEVRGRLAGVSMFTPPLSTQLLSRSLRLTFSATQWASLAQFVPVTPVLPMDREQEEAARHW